MIFKEIILIFKINGEEKHLSLENHGMTMSISNDVLNIFNPSNLRPIIQFNSLYFIGISMLSINCVGSLRYDFRDFKSGNQVYIQIYTSDNPDHSEITEF